MPAPVFMPVSATLPARRTACERGSPGCCAGARRGGGSLRAEVADGGAPFELGAFRAVLGRDPGLRPLVALAFGVLVAFAALDPADARLVLRRPGRDRGRLPRTPGSSLSLPAIRHWKIAVGAASWRPGLRMPWELAAAPVNVDPAPVIVTGGKRSELIAVSSPNHEIQAYTKCGFGVYHFGAVGAPSCLTIESLTPGGINN